MKNSIRFIIGLLLFINLMKANDTIFQVDFENKTIFLDVNSYKILKFDKRIKNIQFTNSESLTAKFIDSKSSPLTTLKIYAKKAGNESSIITFQDDTIISIGFNIVPHLKNLITMIENSYPDVNVEQINDTIFLKGNVPNQKDKTKILDIFTKFGIDPEKQVVDLLSTSNPKMIRIKLYAVEINNDKGLDIKNNWFVSSKNYSRYEITENNLVADSYDSETGEMTYSNKERTYDWNLPLGTVDNANLNDQYSENVASAIDGIMTDAVSLTGGLTGAANYLGKYFNAGLTISYLAEEGVANVLDETTLITLEDKEAIFLAGGEVYVRLEAENAVQLRQINYGLELKLTAKEVMNDEYVHLNITTKSRDLDWANQVDSIPAITNKSINTTVIIKDKATVVLGGLVNNQNAKDIEKIPLLGDLPILGFLFKSSSFVEGKSELVFFITPEIVKAVDNDQINTFNSNKDKMFNRSKTNKQRYLDMLNLNYSKDNDSSEENLNNIDNIIDESNTNKEINGKKEKNSTPKIEEPSVSNNLFKSKKEAELTDEEKHKLRVKEILGY